MVRADRSGRAVRGALAGSLTTLLALSFHVFGGGAAPGAAAVIGSGLAAIWVCTMLAGRRMRPWMLVIAVALAQLVLHTVFSMSTATVIAPVGGAPAHDHGDTAIGTIVHAGHAMWVAHVVAGVVTVAVIVLGDRMLTAATGIGARIRRRLLVVVLAPSPAGPVSVPVPSAPFVPSIADRVVAAVARRGPPVPAAA